MEFKGRVQGPAAQKYAEYAYRIPELPEVDIWQLDPERLRPSEEYPRSVNPPSAPTLPTVDFADYSVKIIDAKDDCMSTVQVWMQPNENTAAREQRLVLEFKAHYPLYLAGDYVQKCITEAINRAFRSALVRPSKSASASHTPSG